MSKVVADMHSDLKQGVPSIVCMHFDGWPNATEHFRLLLGYDEKMHEVIDHDLRWVMWSQPIDGTAVVPEAMATEVSNRQMKVVVELEIHLGEQVLVQAGVDMNMVGVQQGHRLFESSVEPARFARPPL